MATTTCLETPLYSDKEHLLRSDSEDDFPLETPSASSSRPHTTILLLIALFTTFLTSILTTIHITQITNHPFTIPQPTSQPICDHATSRPAWHTLPLHRRHAYTRAVQRLAALPSRLGLGLNTSLYDDFTYVHISLTWQVHHVAVSLPFHRYFVSAFERALQEHGGYDGVMPYWDWAADAEGPLDSSVWDSWAGFGGNGSVGTGCVEGGVFGRVGKVANYSADGYQPHCVQRIFDSNEEDGVLHGKRWSEDIVREIVTASKTYDEFRERLENGPHRHLHLGIGGEMPTASSTNDPLFFLHHAQIDRLWWLWQQNDSERRNGEFSGPIWVPNEGSLAESGAKITDSIKMLGLAQDVTVREVMTTNTGLLCYKYKTEL